MKSGSRRMQIIATVAVSMTYFSSSLVGAWVTPIIPILEEEDSPIPLTHSQGSWIISIGTLSMLFPVLLIPYTVDKFGRKKLLLFTAFPHLIHWLLVATSNSFAMLLAARIVASISGGVIITVGPMYLSEVIEAKIRGSLMVVHTVFANVGILAMYCMGPYTSITVSSAISASAAVVFFCTFFWMPESPYFLLVIGREEKAVNALLRLRCAKDRGEVKEELEMMHRAIQQKEKSKGKYKDLIQQRVHRRTFFLVLGLYVFQMSSGASTIMAYSTTVFEMSGSSLDSNVCSIIVGVVQVLVTIICALLVDRVGRRPLMIYTFFGCAVGMAVEGTYFYFAYINGEVPSYFDWVPLAALILCQVCFWMGYGTVLGTIGGEIYHVSVKGLTTSIISIFVSVYGFFLQKSFQMVCDNAGPYYAFWVFAGFSVVGTVYTFIFLPETKGKTFAEINEEMDKRMAGRSHPAYDEERPPK